MWISIIVFFTCHDLAPFSYTYPTKPSFNKKWWISCSWCNVYAELSTSKSANGWCNYLSHPQTLWQTLCSISTNKKSTTRFPTSHRWTVNRIRHPYAPKGGTKRDFAVFPVNFNFCRKKSLLQSFFMWKLPAAKLYSYIIPRPIYVKVHRWIAGDVPIYQKFVLKVTHPRQQTPILTGAAAVKTVARKVLLSLIGRVDNALPSSHRWTLCVPLSPPKGGSKRDFLHLALPFISSLQLIVDISNLIFGLNISSPSLQMTNRPWNGRGHVTWPILNFSSHVRYLWNGGNYRLQIWCTCWS